MKHRGSASKRRRRWLYAAGVWLLLAAQVQLVFAAELHQHGYPVVPSQNAAQVSSHHGQAPPASADGPFCIVCQIVRQGAARAVLGGPVVQVSGDVVFHPPRVVRRFSSLSISILPVRAPPRPEWF
ncbi:MAG: hypothetical protein ACRD1N_04205 [Terriglobia bacterium]